MTAKDIKTARCTLALTQDKLAAALGVSAQAVYYWEAGERSISKTAAILLQLYLDQPGLIKAKDPLR
jgi:DNA-binding transcriptional regulator YiaG